MSITANPVNTNESGRHFSPNVQHCSKDISEVAEKVSSEEHLIHRQNTCSDNLDNNDGTVPPRFPFLVDNGQDPIKSPVYFKLTLGASMSRCGDESLLKTLKALYPAQAFQDGNVDFIKKSNSEDGANWVQSDRQESPLKNKRSLSDSHSSCAVSCKLPASALGGHHGSLSNISQSTTSVASSAYPTSATTRLTWNSDVRLMTSCFRRSRIFGPTCSLNTSSRNLGSLARSESNSPLSPKPMDPRDRRPSTLLQGRRNSTTGLLTEDITEKPSLLDTPLQRQRRNFHRTLDSRAFIRSTELESPVASGVNRFQKLAKTVRIITAVCLALKSYAIKNVTANWSFEETYLHLQKDISCHPAFNPSNFRQIQHFKGGRRLEHLLTIPPEYRTPQDIQHILAFVRSHRGFQDFPSHVQVKLCLVMQYQCYEPWRIIVKEGRAPSAFYLVLSGTFLEIALLEGINRTATIVCKTRSELLLIYKEDFDKLIRRPLLAQRDIDIQYCLNHPLFVELSRDVLHSHTQDVFYQYFPCGTIIVQDSSTCPFLILVKSGVCAVIGSYRRWEALRGSETGTSEPAISANLEQIFPIYSHMMKLRNPKGPACHNKWQDKSPLLEPEEGQVTVKIRHTLSLRNTSAHPVTSKPVNENKSIQDSRRRSLPCTLDSKLQETKRISQKAAWEDKDASGNTHRSLWLSGAQFSKDESSSKNKQGKLWQMLQDDLHSFAELATLTEGNVFGLETLFGIPGPSVVLLSRGAECLMISKKLFLQQANSKSLSVAGDLVMTLPSPTTLKNLIRENTEWKRYKSDLVKIILSRGITT